MNCDTARRLIERGTRPGSGHPARAQLGFHLSTCAACRSYYDEQTHDQLLASLLAMDADPAPAAPLPAAVAPPPLPRRASRWRWLAMGAGAVALLAALALVGWVVFTLGRIHRSAQAYQIATTIPATPTSAALAPVLPVVASTPMAAARAPTAAPTTAAVASLPTAPPLALPTQTITPVPLDTILAASRATPAPQQGGGRGVLQVAPDRDGAVTMLLLGVDRRPHEGGGTRADTVIVVRLDPDAQRVAMLSLPRDLVVSIPGYGYARINAAHAYGDQDGAGGGLALMRRTVSGLLGVPIDYVAEIDFAGFVGAIDSIGGIDINVPSEIYDPEYPTMDYGYTVAHFLPGEQHMDGERALMYARTRHADSDFRRMDRQQQVLMGVLDNMRAKNSFQQLQSIADISEAMRSYIQTDISEQKMASLAWGFRSLAPSAVERYSLSGADIVEGTNPEDPYALTAAPGAIARLTQLLLHGVAAQAR
ncbi:LytR family transcriptional regulator [Chloroflexia bacterium SDU3-3]|nr:LytR family transcriptional regulator [Chloroflexia bacterium SDU3-3]